MKECRFFIVVSMILMSTLFSKAEEGKDSGEFMQKLAAYAQQDTFSIKELAEAIVLVRDREGDLSEVGSKDSEPYTPLYQILSLSLKKGDAAEIDNSSRYIGELRRFNGGLKNFLGLLVKKGVDVNEKITIDGVEQRTWPVVLRHSGDPSIVEALLERGVTVAKEDIEFVDGQVQKLTDIVKKAETDIDRDVNKFFLDNAYGIKKLLEKKYKATEERERKEAQERDPKFIEQRLIKDTDEKFASQEKRIKALEERLKEAIERLDELDGGADKKKDKKKK